MEDHIKTAWRKSSHSGNGGGNCIEVGDRHDVVVRDSQDREGPRLAVATAEWRAFTERIRRGQ
jgi:hypothetical protein